MLPWYFLKAQIDTLRRINAGENNMWNIVWKEKKRAWLQTLLSVGKISINTIVWVLAFVIYDKSTLFVEKAKVLLKQPEYIESDMLAADKIELIYLSGVVLSGVVVVGIGILFWCIMRSDMKKKRNRMSLLMALGYEKKNIYQFYLKHIIIETGISAVVSGIFSLGAWKLYLIFSEDYAKMLKEVGVQQGMNPVAIVCAVVLAFVIQICVLHMVLQKLKKGNIREMMADKL